MSAALTHVMSVLRLWISKQHRDGLGQPGVNTLLFSKLTASNMYRYGSSVHGTDGLTSPPKDGALSWFIYPILNVPWGERKSEFNLQMLPIKFRLFPPIQFPVGRPRRESNRGPCAPKASALTIAPSLSSKKPSKRKGFTIKLNNAQCACTPCLLNSLILFWVLLVY